MNWCRCFEKGNLIGCMLVSIQKENLFLNAVYNTFQMALLGNIYISGEVVDPNEQLVSPLQFNVLQYEFPCKPAVLKLNDSELEANTTDYYFGPRSGLAWGKLCHSAQDIRSLQRSIDRLASSQAGGGHDAPPQRASRFVAISALYWTAFVRSKKGQLAPEDITYLAFPGDLRQRLHLPISRDADDGCYYYLGACVKKCLASASAGELLGASGLLHASRAIQAALREVAAAPLAGTEVPWAERVIHVPPGRLAGVAGYPLPSLYETGDDFGFGKPALVEYMPLDYDGRMMLSGGRKDGEVQVSVSLDRTRMDAFVAHVVAAGKQAKTLI